MSTRTVAARGGESLKFLVVEDDATSRMILVRMLAKAGYEVVSAHNGEKAVECFQAEQPDMILMDVQMPVMDGWEATRRIKELSGDRFVPVIFLTASHDSEQLARCVECGGDDFLTKPYNPIILRAKIDALGRIRALHAEITVQRDQIRHHQARLIQEQEMAETVFQRMTQRGGRELPGVEKLISPASIFNGDLVLSVATPFGCARVLMGDFTGHGLSAAMGALPVCDTFYSMTAKGFSIADLVSEMNGKLHQLLPTGRFFACTVLELDPTNGSVSIWSGGLPDVLIRGADGGIRERLPSRHLALGIVGDDQLDPTVEMVTLAPGEQVLMYTDGVIEAASPSGEMWGQSRLERWFSGSHDRLFDELREEIGRYCGGYEQQDDITLVQVAYEGSTASDDVEATRIGVFRDPLHWECALRLEADTLRRVDPIPLIMQMLIDLQGLRPHRQNLYLVLSELYTNSVNHGLLGLDSAMKESAGGFGEYYALRDKRLAELTDGWVRLTLRHERSEQGGRLVVVVEDNGSGFDVYEDIGPLAANAGHSGRGIALVRTLCEQLSYSDAGRKATAVYAWGGSP